VVGGKHLHPAAAAAVVVAAAVGGCPCGDGTRRRGVSARGAIGGAGFQTKGGPGVGEGEEEMGWWW
jgi:hypothetical protein